ncbi:MAG: hypothetical protein HY010_14620 [Acidobacteria bacterium]|nr:hypothetical protein [Acidobacteriota bacterium]
MAVTVYRTTIWCKHTTSTTTMLADALAPISEAGTNLVITAGHSVAGRKNRTIAVHPLLSRSAVLASRRRGFARSAPVLIVSGDFEIGLGDRIATAVAARGVEVRFVSAMGENNRFVAALGFESDAAARSAAKAIRTVESQKPVHTQRGRPRMIIRSTIDKIVASVSTGGALGPKKKPKTPK